MDELARFLQRAEALLDRVERLLPLDVRAPDFAVQRAFRWRRRNARGYFQGIAHPHGIRLQDLQGIDRQKGSIDQNTRQFVRGLPANNVLLTGARGTGKSSLVKALLNQYGDQGLRLVEVDKQDLMDLPDIIAALDGQ